MKLVFLGDSITDCGHCFTADNLGNVYVKHVSMGLLPSCTVENGGTDGFTFPRILKKWEQFYSHKPYDIVVVLGGINDVAEAIDGASYAFAPVYPSASSSYSESPKQSAYDPDILAQSESALFNLINKVFTAGTSHIILIEPFLFPNPAFLSLWQGALEDMRKRIRSAAFPYPHVHLLSPQPFLDEIALEKGISALTSDGIHLTDLGHRQLSRLILDTLHPLISK